MTLSKFPTSLIAIAGFFFGVFVAAPQVALAEEEYAKEIRFETSEGTWMSLDTSPDDQQLVFDLLGDIYTLSARGGRAENIVPGASYDHMPRWSPDGQHIAFISDRSGSDNLWVMGVDGSNPRRLSDNEKWGMSSPAWSPDGRHLSVIRRSGNAYSIWQYAIDGSGGVSLDNRGESTEAVDINPKGMHTPQGPVYSADGRYLFYAAGTFTLEPSFDVWQIYRRDLNNNEIVQITTRYGHSVRPQVAPDGRHIAFTRYMNGVDGLWLKDLVTGKERLLVEGISHGIQRLPRDIDQYPAYTFSGDGKYVILSYGGKLMRVSVDTGATSEIPFVAEVSQTVKPYPHFRHSLQSESWRTKVIASPDMDSNGTLVFEALGKLWLQKSGSEKPVRLTSQNEQREYTPALSPDGRWVAYVTWDDEKLGRVWKAPLDGGDPIPLTDLALQYANPSWSPDGKQIAVTWQRAELSYREPFFPEGTLFRTHHEVGYVSAEGGDLVSVSTVLAKQFYAQALFTRPVFSADGKRLMFRQLSGAHHQLLSVDLQGADRRVEVQMPANFHTLLPSPDLSRLAFADSEQLYIAELPRSDTMLEVDPNSDAIDSIQISDYGGDFPRWTGDSLTWVNGSTVYRTAVETHETEVHPVALTVPRYRPQGTLVLKNARLITMVGDEVIAKGDIVITDGRIVDAGKTGRVKKPKGATIYDLKGKTIMPGMVDTHYHGQLTAADILPETRWQFAADLAFGVTSGRDPAGPTNDMFRHVDLIESGEMLGPRLLNSGYPAYPWDKPIKSLEDARTLVKNRKLHGAQFVKQHSNPRRDVRQWMQRAAAEASLMVAAEGYDHKQQITLIQDGFTSVEHSHHAAPLYWDVIQMYAQSGVYYVPTLLIGYVAPRGLDYFYQYWDWYKNEKVQRFMPPDMLARYARHRIVRDRADYFFEEGAAATKQLLDRGVKVALGGHGNHPGLGAHWELWTFVMGGMTTFEALRAATMTGAELLGWDEDIGSIEKGKLADLIVLNSNPLEDIQNSLDIQYVVKNGELFAGETLDKLWPQPQKLGKLF